MTVDLYSKASSDRILPSPPSPDGIIDKIDALVGSQNLNLDPADIQIRASALFARLKALNRAANASVKSHKQITADACNEMDHTNLGLQNLQYEKRHLEREIDKCRQFASIYQDVPLHSMEDFLEQAPEDLHKTEFLDNEHQLMLNRLNFELSERLRLEQRRKELQQQKDELLKLSKIKSGTIESVKAQIDLLAKTATDIQKKVDEFIQPISSSITSDAMVTD